MQCSQCSKKMTKMIFDIGYAVEVAGLHCKNCGLNSTDEGVLDKALNALQKRVSKESPSQAPPEPF